eukprot:scaffold166540_cov34-Tisochrysis_lutea.AAC.1
MSRGAALPPVRGPPPALMFSSELFGCGSITLEPCLAPYSTTLLLPRDGGRWGRGAGGCRRLYTLEDSLIKKLDSRNYEHALERHFSNVFQALLSGPIAVRPHGPKRTLPPL